MIKATVITDASFSDGLTKKLKAKKGIKNRLGAAGWAAWIKIDGKPEGIRQYGEIRELIPNSTYAEMYAALNGIWLAVQAGAEGILLRTDCMAVVQLVDGSARAENPMRQIWQACLQRPDMRGLQKLTAKHVKGHTAGNCRATWVNNWADEHARKGLYRARRRFGL